MEDGPEQGGRTRADWNGRMEGSKKGQLHTFLEGVLCKVGMFAGKGHGVRRVSILEAAIVMTWL